jgi:predicted MFS family arabinose efflux permease
MMLKKLLPLAVALLMFPQIAQTLYSPALSDIAATFRVSPEQSAQTLSVFFLAFAPGVVVWGRISDSYGRRPAMLAGLFTYALGTCLALAVRGFNGLLLAQAVAAFGAAVGSVVTQTVLRDRYKGPDLAQVFSLMGIALAASPALGLFAGSALVQGFGYRGVLTCLLSLAAVLWTWSAWGLPETRCGQVTAAPVIRTLRLMLVDPAIWRSATGVAVFNVALFSYYSLGPFMFKQLGLSDEAFGYSGLLLALGSASGAWLNKFLLARGADSMMLVKFASLALLAGGLLIQSRIVLFIWPMLLVVLAFGMAIPNILGTALAAYQDRLGTAGALFGLLYYLLIGLALAFGGWFQALGWTLLACAAIALLAGCQWSRRRADVI